MTSVQHDINSHMRAILVDWLVEVAEEYHLHSETLYSCVSEGQIAGVLRGHGAVRLGGWPTAALAWQF